MIINTPCYFNDEKFVLITNEIIEGVDQGRYYVGSNGNIYDSCTNSYLHIYADRAGYCNVNLHTSNGTKRFLLHRIVGMAFINGDRSLQINHKNGFKFNNYDENLEWATPRENLMHALDTGLNYRGEDKPNAILTNDEAHTICKMLEEHKNYYEISEALGYKYEEIKDILIDIKRRKSWKTISCNYNFSNDKISNERSLTYEQVNQICRIYEENPKATASVIFNALGMTFNSKEEKESMRHKVDSIKEHKAYKDISKNYNF